MNKPIYRVIYYFELITQFHVFLGVRDSVGANCHSPFKGNLPLIVEMIFFYCFIRVKRDCDRHNLFFAANVQKIKKNNNDEELIFNKCIIF